MRPGGHVCWKDTALLSVPRFLPSIPWDRQKERSVGVFIKGVDHLIVDLNTGAILKPGEQGMILVKGENIFNGYPDKNIPSPFVKVGEEQYYKTGDLGYVDEDGYLFITGRLKRFIKIGGEMISLPAIENALLKKYNSEEKTLIAIEGYGYCTTSADRTFYGFEGSDARGSESLSETKWIFPT